MRDRRRSVGRPDGRGSHLIRLSQAPDDFHNISYQKLLFSGSENKSKAETNYSYYWFARRSFKITPTKKAKQGPARLLYYQWPNIPVSVYP